MKSKIAITLGLLALSTAIGSAAATDVTSAITGVAGDAGDGVTAGVTIGAVVFGAKVVWSAIKSLAS